MQLSIEASHDYNPSETAGTLIAGRYRLDTIIGRGGTATVWRARDERLGRDVAVKLCRTSQLPQQAAVGEERFSGALLHPNIVSIFDAGELQPPGQCGRFVVMEYVDGATAQQIAPVAWRQAVDIVRQAADGLAALHHHGIIHCDVKPGNLLIDRRGRVLVADLGIATEVHGELGDYVHGSPAYLAPERLSGECASPRVDVYGLGGVLAFLLTGQRPLDGPLALPLSCPPPIAEVVGRARSTDPGDRYVDARAFRVALDSAAEQAEHGEDRLVREETLASAGRRDRAGASRQVISHPMRERRAVRRPSAQETAALTASPARVEVPVAAGSQQPFARLQVATIFTAMVIVLFVLLLVGLIVRQVVTEDAAMAGPPLSQIMLVAPR